MITLYNELLYKPILNVLIFFYNIFPGNDLGLAIIGVTLVIRFVLYPMYHKSIKAQKDMQALQPKLEEIKQKHADDKQKQMEEMMAIYKEHKVNPLGSCLPLIIQGIVLFALYRVLITQLSERSFEGLYSFVAEPEILHPIAFGFLNLAEKNVILALITAVLQYFQAKMLQTATPTPSGGGTENMAAMIQKQMLYILPVMTFVFAMSFPSGLALYWATSTVFAIVQQWFIIKQRNKLVSSE